jgi:hypothetical protein
MQRLEVSGAVRPVWWPLGVKGLIVFSRLSLLQVVIYGDEIFNNIMHV